MSTSLKFKVYIQCIVLLTKLEYEIENHTSPISRKFACEVAEFFLSMFDLHMEFEANAEVTLFIQHCCYCDLNFYTDILVKKCLLRNDFHRCKQMLHDCIMVPIEQFL
jgi:hypothetical protein